MNCTSNIHYDELSNITASGGQCAPITCNQNVPVQSHGKYVILYSVTIRSDECSWALPFVVMKNDLSIINIVSVVKVIGTNFFWCNAAYALKFLVLIWLLLKLKHVVLTLVKVSVMFFYTRVKGVIDNVVDSLAFQVAEEDNKQSISTFTRRRRQASSALTVGGDRCSGEDLTFESHKCITIHMNRQI
jgi:hypothetical protein